MSLSVSQIKSKILNDFGFLANMVVNNNLNGVNNAIQTVASVYYNLGPEEAVNYIMSIYRASPQMAAQALNCRYIYGVLPPEYDQAVRELSNQAFVNQPVLKSTQAQNDGSASTNWDWNQFFDSFSDNAGGIITSLGNVFNPQNTTQVTTPNQTLPGGGNPPPAAAPTDYTKYILPGVGILLAVVAVVVLVKQLKKK